MRLQFQNVFDTGRSLVGEVELTVQGATATWETLLTPIQGERGRVEVVVVALPRHHRVEEGRAGAARERGEIPPARRELHRHDLAARSGREIISIFRPPAAPHRLRARGVARTLALRVHPSRRPARDLGDALDHPPVVRHLHGHLPCPAQGRPHDLAGDDTARTIRDPNTGEVVEIQCAFARRLRPQGGGRRVLREPRGTPGDPRQLDGGHLRQGRRGPLRARQSLVRGSVQSFTRIGHRQNRRRHLPGEQAKVLRANDLEVLRKGEPIAFEEVVPHDDGPHTYISIKFPLRTSAGVPWAIGGISTDITDQKQTQEQLVRQNELLDGGGELGATGARRARSGPRASSSRPRSSRALGQMVAGRGPRDQQPAGLRHQQRRRPPARRRPPPRPPPPLPRGRPAPSPSIGPSCTRRIRDLRRARSTWPTRSTNLDGLLDPLARGAEADPADRQGPARLRPARRGRPQGGRPQRRDRLHRQHHPRPRQTRRTSTWRPTSRPCRR